VRPAGTHHCLTLLDDLDSQSLAKLVSDGLKPAAVIETSPGNFHAWLRHPARLDPAVNTRLSQTLAARYGSDPGSADWRHFGRLAGFTNRKSAYRSARGQFPFCLLRESSAAIVDLSSDIAEAAASLQAEAEEMAAVARRHAERRASGIAPERASRSIASFHTDPRYGGDLTRADLAYAVYALSRDVSAADVSAALAARDLSHKGGSKRQHEYVARTLEKALSTVVAATA
jgi:hypothetical protein